MSTDDLSIGRRGKPGTATIAALLLSAIVFLALSRLVETTPTISDALGYLYAGERLAAGAGPTYEDANDAIAGPYFVLYAFQVARPGDSRHFLGFPPGFPILLAAGAMAGVIHYVTPFLAGLTILATYGLGTALTGSRGAGLAAAVLLAITPAFWQFGTAAWSEIPATLAVTTGLFLFVESRKRHHRALTLSLLAAAVLSFGHFIRYTSVTFLAAAAVYDLYTARRGLLTQRWRWSFWLATAAGLLAIPLFNHFYYGGALTTSYSPAHGWYAQPPFSPAYALGPSFVDGFSLRESVRTLWINFSILSVLALAGWWKLPPAGRALVAAAVVFGSLPYLVYAFAPSGINSRFLLPIFPFVSICAGLAVTLLLWRLPGPVPRIVAGASVVIVSVYLVAGHWREISARNASSESTTQRAATLVAGMESEAVVLSYVYNDMIAIYGGRSVLNYRRIPASDERLGRYRTEMLEPCMAGSINRLLARSIPVYYIEDRQPSYWDSLDILKRHFTLSEPAGSPPVYRIIAPTRGDALDESACRFSD